MAHIRLASYIISSLGRFGSTPILAEELNSSEAEAVLASSKDPNAADEAGLSSLHLAAQRASKYTIRQGRDEVLGCLLE